MFKDYNYSDLQVSGVITDKVFNGQLDAADPNLKLNFSGLVDFSDNENIYDFSAIIDYANLNALKLVDRDKISVLKGEMSIDMKGTSIDDVYGVLSFKDALYENQDDPRSVVRVIDLYKVDKGLDTKSRKKSSKDAASAVVTKRSTKPSQAETDVSFTESMISKMSIKEFEKNQEAIMEAQRSGKFIYDLSGAAR